MEQPARALRVPATLQVFLLMLPAELIAQPKPRALDLREARVLHRPLFPAAEVEVPPLVRVDGEPLGFERPAQDFARPALQRGAAGVKVLGYLPLALSVFLIASFIALVAFRFFISPLFE